jgi:outer membrane receptor protein involved in Fe transport
MKTAPLSKAIRAAISASVLAGVAVPAFAQEAQEEELQVEEITVTGSRISRPDLDSASPVTVISREDMVVTGVTDIGALIQRNPAASGSPIGTTTNNGGNGGVFVDLRGEGAIRTLNLVNGRRTVDGGDYQAIPGAMIERVELLKDGASAVYGADAVAGVVNIITRSDFEGVEVELQQSDAFDVTSIAQTSASLLAGASFDRGNVVFGVEFVEQEGAFQSDYPWDFLQGPYYIYPDLSCVDGNDPTGCFFLGSSRIPEGRLTFQDANGSNVVLMNEDGSGLTPYDGRTYNYAPVNYLQTPYTRLNVFSEGRFEVSKNVEAFVEFRANQRSSAQELAPQPYNSPTDPSYNGGISGDNYYWDRAYQAYLATNPSNIDNLSSVTPNVTDARRRMVETSRRFEQEVTQFQFVFGFQGDLGFKDWTWDASMNTGYRERLDTDYGQFFGPNLERALGPSADLDGDGTPECYVDINDPTSVIAGCVPMDLTGGAGTITDEMLAYVEVPLTDHIHTEQQQFMANIAGTAFALPAGDVGFAAGYEFRKESSTFRPDAAKVMRAVTGNKGAGTEGEYDVSSFYAEALIPVFDNGSQSMFVNAGVRYDDYSTFGGNTAYQIKVDGSIIEDLRYRATYGTTFRAPGIGELYAGEADSFPTYDDPCNAANFANSPFCAQVAPQLDSQVQATVGGNPDLQPESGDTFTAGLVYSPTFAGVDMNFTVDYWQINLEDVISSLGVSYILDACYVDGDAAACDLVTRRGDYSVSNVRDTSLNVASRKSAGVDFMIDASTEVGPGLLSGDFLWTRLLKKDRVAFDGAEVGDLIGVYNGSAYAEDKMSYSVGYMWNDLSITYMGEYISALDAEISFIAGTQPIEAQLYHDIVGSYEFTSTGTRLQLGLTNITDEEPPYIDFGFNGSTDPSTYRLNGRSYYLRITQSF